MEKPPAPAAPLAALIQMTSSIDPAVNLATIDRAMEKAAASGAAMAFLPEMSLLLDRDRARSAAHIAREADSPWPAALQDMARKHALWLHSGSMPLLAHDGEKPLHPPHRGNFAPKTKGYNFCRPPPAGGKTGKNGGQ